MITAVSLASLSSSKQALHLKISCLNLLNSSVSPINLKTAAHKYWKSFVRNQFRLNMWTYPCLSKYFDFSLVSHIFPGGAWELYGEPEWCLSDKADSWMCGLEGVTQHSFLCALLAPKEDEAGWETALWRLCLRQIVRGIAHLFYQFTDLLYAGSSALITTAQGSHAIF